MRMQRQTSFCLWARPQTEQAADVWYSPTNRKGMFSFSGLNKDQVERLKAEHAIYIVGSGRINVAGMTDDNLDILCKAVVSVL